ncbi:MAG: Septum formation initiator [Bacteroidetes bacterium]|nr:Septum formation initiator [Bacteroidota bacterium]
MLNYSIRMKKVVSALKNKYLLTVIGLAVWVIFFDKNDLRTQLELRKEVKQLQEERNYYAHEIAEISSDLKELTSNPKTLEKFAREKYLMKRDNEEIFKIVEEKN